VHQGEDITIVGHGRMVHLALEAAKTLEDSGVSAEVIDLRSLRPYDLPTLVESVRKTNRAVYVEEGWGTYGIGAEIAAAVSEAAFDYLDAPVLRVFAADVPMPYSKPLERLAMPSAGNIVDAAKRSLNIA
jgi:pyruvate dehydrogenase E1 component beta subunit